jgi:hypothetical protein
MTPDKFRFVVFKSPPEGCTHIFRPGEPMLQGVVLSVQADFDQEEAAEREMRGRRIHASCPTLAAETTWASDTARKAVMGNLTTRCRRPPKIRFRLKRILSPSVGVC